MPETAPASTLALPEDSEPTMPPPITVPVYAAGPGMAETALDVLDLAGWHRYDDGACNVTFRSPDGSVTGVPQINALLEG